MFSCIPVCERTLVVFRNYTKDTLIIGVSNINNIDSVNDIMQSCNLNTDSIDIQNVSLWNNICFDMNKEMIICPDSTCMIDKLSLFQNTDTCYFF